MSGSGSALSTKDAEENAAVIPAPPAETAGPAHLRARASRSATIALAIAVAAVLTVATGVLAAPGAALGLLAVLFAMGGLAAARQRHVAGAANAMIALLLGLTALAVGALAVTGEVAWPDVTANNVTRLHEWLQAHAPWVTPQP